MISRLVNLDVRGVMIRVHSDNLPVGAGLGSSAAFSVALSAALFKIHSFLLLEEGWNQPVPAPDSKPSQWFGSPPSSALDVINSYAFLAETLIHGNPSGIDNTISCFGGVICYTKNVEAGHVTTEAISDFPPLSILVTNTGVPRSTKKLVSEVGKFSEKYPELARGIFDAIGGISRLVSDKKKVWPCSIFAGY